MFRTLLGICLLACAACGAEHSGHNAQYILEDSNDGKCGVMSGIYAMKEGRTLKLFAQGEQNACGAEIAAQLATDGSGPTIGSVDLFNNAGTREFHVQPYYGPDGILVTVYYRD